MAISNNTTKLQALLDKANSLPEAGGVDLPKLTSPATANEVFLNKEYIDSEGTKQIGTFTIENELSNQDELLATLWRVLEGKAAGSPVTAYVENNILYIAKGE